MGKWVKNFLLGSGKTLNVSAPVIQMVDGATVQQAQAGG